MRRLLPDPGPTSVDEQLDSYRPWESPPADRPYLAVNFVATVDGRATIEGRSGKIGSATDTLMLSRLRTRFDALMIGAGTMRAERYGRILNNPPRREEREALGLSPDPLMVIVSGRLELPWDAPLFTEGGGKVIVFTSSEREPPATETTVEVIRHEGGVDLGRALAQLRTEHGVRALICEGGPRLHSQLQAGDAVDELFLTVAPKLTGAGPAILQGELPATLELELGWLLEESGELFARYLRA